MVSKRGHARSIGRLLVFEAVDVLYSVGPCVISCKIFVKSEFPLDSALICDSD